MRRYYEEDYLLGGCGRPSVDGFPMSLPEESLVEGLQFIGGDRVKVLVSKLRSGKPIVVHAYGGSISLQNGGCWNHANCVPSCPESVPRFAEIIGSNPLYPSGGGCYLVESDKAISILKRGWERYQDLNPDCNKTWIMPTSPLENLGFG